MPKLPTYIFALVVAVAALGYAGWRYYSSTGGMATSGEAAIGGPFTLVDQNGETRTRDDFAGQYRLIYFGYTFCPDVCPTALWAMSQALDQVAEDDPGLAERITPVFITVDPERDTVEHMKDYAANFHPRMVALTGTPEQIAQAAKAYRVFYRKAEDDSATEYLMDHSSFIFLMSPNGKYLTHATHQDSPDEIARMIEQAAAD